MKKEFNGETWLLITLIILSSFSYWYLHENKPYLDKTNLKNKLDLTLKVEDKENNISKSVDFIDQKIIKKSIEIIKEDSLSILPSNGNVEDQIDFYNKDEAPRG